MSVKPKALLAVAAIVALSSCTLTSGPVITYAGFRLDGSDLLVAMPLCSGDKVESAAVVVESGKGDGFETLWSAREPRSDEVRSGVFHVNSQRSFATVTKQLSGALPGEFYVETRQDRKGRIVTDSGYVDLSEIKSVELAGNEFVTHKGKIMTRDEINAQAYCGEKE